MAVVPEVLEGVDAVMSVLSLGPWLGTGGDVHEFVYALMSVSMSRCLVLAGVVRGFEIVTVGVAPSPWESRGR